LLYQNKCQICGKKIKLKNDDYSEAHHIKPLGKHNGPDTSNNIIILCPNHHVEFDYGGIAINPNTLEIIHKDNKNEFMAKRIFLHPSHKLRKEFLEYHLKNIFNEGEEK
jgi:predicted restriction endonuclease